MLTTNANTVIVHRVQFTFLILRPPVSHSLAQYKTLWFRYTLVQVNLRFKRVQFFT
jgi:hypothetical protein